MSLQKRLNVKMNPKKKSKQCLTRSVRSAIERKVLHICLIEV